MNTQQPDSLGRIRDVDELIDYLCPAGRWLFPNNKWWAENKYNGWRVLVNRDGVPITRHGKSLAPSIQEAFETTVLSLCGMINWEFCELVDCEFMAITPKACPKGTIVAFDCIGGPSSSYGLDERREAMWLTMPEVFYQSTAKQVFLPQTHLLDHDKLKAEMSRMINVNLEADQTLHEGFVFKKLSARYGAKKSWFKLRLAETYIKENAYEK